MTTRKLLYKTGGQQVESKEFTELPEGKIRLINQNDYMEFLNFSVSLLIKSIDTLNESIEALRKDLRLIRVGNEEFVYGEKVGESEEVDKEEIEI